MATRETGGFRVQDRLNLEHTTSIFRNSLQNYTWHMDWSPVMLIYSIGNYDRCRLNVWYQFKDTKFCLNWLSKQVA
jgi:hypothetical protein